MEEDYSKCISLLDTLSWCTPIGNLPNLEDLTIATEFYLISNPDVEDSSQVLTIYTHPDLLKER